MEQIMTTRFDTLRTFTAIKAAGVDETAAQAITTAIQDSILDVRDQLSTKADVEGLRTSIKSDIENVRVKLEAEFTVVRGEMKTWAADIGSKISDAQTASIRWTAGLLIAAVSTTVALIKLL